MRPFSKMIFRHGCLATCLIGLMALMLWTPHAAAQDWSDPVRGSWVRQQASEPGDITLARPDEPGVEIVLPDGAHSAVQQAATFLAGDIEQISGHRPSIVATSSDERPAIRLVTLEENAPADMPDDIDVDRLHGQWEAYQIATDADAQTVWLVGSNARGTAFAAYTLSERLGIDPLHHWTQYRPERHEQLVLKNTNHFVPSPTFKYRGLFHDDEDILPRPFEFSGYPLRIGNVPLEWYKRFFETALRLRMNMVAPYTRVYRRFEVQKTASDWGLYFTSHHYDILLSNPFGYNRFRLAEQRGITGRWDWYENRENMLRYWAAGVEENGELDTIWPVGLRGTEDHPYHFPAGTSEEEQNLAFREAIDAQLELTRERVPPDKQPVFHFTLYDEMLSKYLAGSFEMPEDVILVWCDDNDGRMRALPDPDDLGDWKHGVYYHAAYYGPVTKQVMHIVPPVRIADQFKKIVHSGATEFMLLNVSELRTFVMETRMIAEICWDAESTLGDTPVTPMPDYVLAHVPTAATRPLPEDTPSPSAERFVRWWSAEYFGEDVADQVVEAYDHYDSLLDQANRQWYAAERVVGALRSLVLKFTGEQFIPARPETLPTLKDLDERYIEAFELIDHVRPKLASMQRQFFFDHVELPLLVTWRHTQAAILLVEAMAEPDLDESWAMCEQAMKPLEQLEIEILRAEYPPFERWYARSFIRHEETSLNWHRPHEQLRAFLTSGGTALSSRSDRYRHPNLQKFLPILEQE